MSKPSHLSFSQLKLLTGIQLKAVLEEFCLQHRGDLNDDWHKLWVVPAHNSPVFRRNYCYTTMVVNPRGAMLCSLSRDLRDSKLSSLEANHVKCELQRHYPDLEFVEDAGLTVRLSADYSPDFFSLLIYYIVAGVELKD